MDRGGGREAIARGVLSYRDGARNIRVPGLHPAAAARVSHLERATRLRALLEVLMLFSATALPGVVVVEIDPIEDMRGFFARTWCAVEFARNGMAAEMVQASIAFNKKK